eukprot:363203-Chlamydomonas_euryale.AAC.44
MMSLSVWLAWSLSISKPSCAHSASTSDRSCASDTTSAAARAAATRAWTRASTSAWSWPSWLSASRHHSSRRSSAAKGGARACVHHAPVVLKASGKATGIPQSQQRDSHSNSNGNGNRNSHRSRNSNSNGNGNRNSHRSSNSNSNGACMWVLAQMYGWTALTCWLHVHATCAWVAPPCEPRLALVVHPGRPSCVRTKAGPGVLPTPTLAQVHPDPPHNLPPPPPLL